MPLYTPEDVNNAVYTASIQKPAVNKPLSTILAPESHMCEADKAGVIIIPD